MGVSCSPVPRIHGQLFCSNFRLAVCRRREEKRGEGGEKRRKICILALNSVGTYGTLWLSVACLSLEREREREAAGGAALLFQTMVPRGVYFHDAVISTDQSSNIDKELIS